MEAPVEVPTTSPWWRSRMFVQPLLLTIGGGVASVAILAGIGFVRSQLDPCPGCDLGYGVIEALITGLLFLAAGWLLTGFIVGWSSPDYRDARRAILVAVVFLAVAAAVTVMANDASDGALEAEQFRDDLLTFPLAALMLLVVIGTGFAAGRFIRTRRGRAPH